jgi:hypothetical protein
VHPLVEIDLPLANYIIRNGNCEEGDAEDCREKNIIHVGISGKLTSARCAITLKTSDTHCSPFCKSPTLRGQMLLCLAHMQAPTPEFCSPVVILVSFCSRAANAMQVVICQITVNYYQAKDRDILTSFSET